MSLHMALTSLSTVILVMHTPILLSAFAFPFTLGALRKSNYTLIFWALILDVVTAASWLVGCLALIIIFYVRPWLLIGEGLILCLGHVCLLASIVHMEWTPHFFQDIQSFSTR